MGEKEKVATCLFSFCLMLKFPDFEKDMKVISKESLSITCIPEEVKAKLLSIGVDVKAGELSKFDENVIALLLSFVNMVLKN